MDALDPDEPYADVPEESVAYDDRGAYALEELPPEYAVPPVADDPDVLGDEYEARET